MPAKFLIVLIAPLAKSTMASPSLVNPNLNKLPRPFAVFRISLPVVLIPVLNSLAPKPSVPFKNPLRPTKPSLKPLKIR